MYTAVQSPPLIGWLVYVESFSVALVHVVFRDVCESFVPHTCLSPILSENSFLHILLCPLRPSRLWHVFVTIVTLAVCVLCFSINLFIGCWHTSCISMFIYLRCPSSPLSLHFPLLPCPSASLSLGFPVHQLPCPYTSLSLKTPLSLTPHLPPFPSTFLYLPAPVPLVLSILVSHSVPILPSPYLSLILSLYPHVLIPAWPSVCVL